MDLDSLEAKIQAAIAGSRGAVRRARRSALNTPALSLGRVLRLAGPLFFPFFSQLHACAVSCPEHFAPEKQCGQPFGFAITRHSRGCCHPQRHPRANQGRQGVASIVTCGIAWIGRHRAHRVHRRPAAAIWLAAGQRGRSLHWGGCHARSAVRAAAACPAPTASEGADRPPAAPRRDRGSRRCRCACGVSWSRSHGCRLDQARAKPAVAASAAACRRRPRTRWIRFGRERSGPCCRCRPCCRCFSS